VRCSYFEMLLPGYVDGTLAPAASARLEAHVRDCPACSSLLTELRVVDGLLVAPATPAPAANFTFKVMADVRALPPPVVRPARHVAMIAAYVAFGWAAIASYLIWGGAGARAALAWLRASAGGAGTSLAVLTSASSHLFGTRTLDVTAAAGVLLGVDVTGVVLIVALYALLRARRVTATIPVEETR